MLPSLLVAAFLVATAVKHFVFNPLSIQTPRPSSIASRQAEVSAEPNVVKITDAWYESVVQDEPYLVWFTVQRTLPGHFLCFRFPAWESGEYVFFLDGAPMSVRGQGDLYWARREGEPREARAETWFVEADHLQYDFELRKKMPVAQVTFTPRDAR